MLSPDLEIKALLNRSISDVYGRAIGRVIGVNRNQFGEMEGLEVESQSGTIIDVPARGVMLTPKSITIVPEWKIQATELASEIGTIKKRINALENLQQKGEVDRDIYEELVEAQKLGYSSRLQKAQELTLDLRDRLEKTNGKLASLTRHLINAKLDYQSGELDEASMKLAVDSIQPTIRPLLAEKNDLSQMLSTMESLLPTRIKVV